MTRLGVFLPLALSLFAASASWAQPTGSVVGRILDAETKQPLPGASVRVEDTTLGAATDSEGRFEIVRVPEGRHTLEVRFVGYRPHLEPDVRVVRGRTTTVEEVELAPAAVTAEGVTVTPDAGTDLAPLPASETTLAREEIRRSPGAAGDVVRAVTTLPGVSASDGEFSAFSVRGSNTTDNLILVDNIPFDKVSHFEGGSSEQESSGGRFSVFTGGLVEDATFSAGGFGAQYGRKGASVLDLQLKEGDPEAVRADASYDLLGAEVNYDGPSYLLGTTSVVFNARRFDLSGPFELIGRGDFGDPVMTDVILKTTTRLGADHKVSLLGLYSDDDFVRSVGNVLEADDLVENDLWSIQETRTLGGLNWRWLTSGSSFLRTTAYVRGNDRERTLGDVAAVGGGLATPASAAGLVVRDDVLRQEEQEVEVGLRSDFTQVVSDGVTVRLGGEVYGIDLDYRQRLSATDTLYTFGPDDPRPGGQRFLVVTPEQAASAFDDASVHGGAFASVALSRGGLTVEPGLRYTYNGFSTDSYLAPRLQATYRLDARTAVNAAAGVYYQQPLYPVVALDAANQGLRNESSIHAVLGLSRQLGRDLRLTVEGYYKDLDDLAVRRDRLSNVFTSTGRGWTSGVDAILIKRFSSRYFGQVSYSFAAAERDDRDGRGSYTAYTNQPHILNVVFGVEVNDNLFVSGKWKYAVGRPTDRFRVYEDVHGSEGPLRFSQEVVGRADDRLRDFHLLNVRVDYRLQLGRLGVVTFLDLYNVYNRTNPNESRFSELAGIRRDLGFGVVGAGGVKLEI